MATYQPTSWTQAKAAVQYHRQATQTNLPMTNTNTKTNNKNKSWATNQFKLQFNATNKLTYQQQRQRQITKTIKDK